MSVNQSVDLDHVRAILAKSVHDHWVFYFIEGFALLALGITAILMPAFATLGITIVIGWVFLASGIIGLAMTVAARHAPGFWWALLSALLGIGAGLVLLARPASGAVSLAIVMTAFFFAEGVASIMFGLAHRRHVPAWRWLVASGGIDLILAIIIMAGLPGTAAWTLGLLVGINMMFGGVSLAAVALHARRSGAH